MPQVRGSDSENPEEVWQPLLEEERRLARLWDDRLGIKRNAEKTGG